jgi:hypothetical protein
MSPRRHSHPAKSFGAQTRVVKCRCLVMPKCRALHGPDFRPPASGRQKASASSRRRPTLAARRWASRRTSLFARKSEIRELESGTTIDVHLIWAVVCANCPTFALSRADYWRVPAPKPAECERAGGDDHHTERNPRQPRVHISQDQEPGTMSPRSMMISYGANLTDSAPRPRSRRSLRIV